MRFSILVTPMLAAGIATSAPAGQAMPVQDAAWHNRQSLALAERSAGDGWQITPTGLHWRRIKGDGSGRHPIATDTVTVHYVGTFVDGAEFDSSIRRGTPATFPIAMLIRGWREGLPLAGIGDTIELAIPAALAYGPEGKDRHGKHVVPGGATLLFRFELLDIAAPAAG